MPWGVVAGSVASSVSSSNAADKNRKAAKKAAKAETAAAEKQYANSQPYNTSGALGNVSFDSVVDPQTGLTEQNNLKLTLADPYQEEHDYLLGSPAIQRGYIKRFEGDPEAASESYFQRNLKRNREQQERRSEATENDLVRRGMLGSTGGANLMQAVYEAELKEDRDARIAADAQVQSLIDTYRGRGAVDRSAAMGIEGALHEYANLGLRSGSNQAVNAANLAKGKTNAAQTTAQAAINSNNTNAAGVSNVFNSLGYGYATDMGNRYGKNGSGKAGFGGLFS